MEGQKAAVCRVEGAQRRGSRAPGGRCAQPGRWGLQWPLASKPVSAGRVYRYVELFEYYE